jgi:hypothetical protein
MYANEAIKKELLEKGFTYNESSKLWYYEYSEFEVLLPLVIGKHNSISLRKKEKLLYGNSL